jgi:uncharacterized protein (DUF2126 family)
VPGTVRYVDSSVERLQVKITGNMTADRYVLTCNGRAVPLQSTGTNGEFVAASATAPGSRSCLHPTIGVHAPLVFDLVDTWMQRSLGGCQYHVTHPGGRSYDTFPVNANRGRGRRLARFFRFGHTPGKMQVSAPEVSAEHPFTLDLRRF